MAAGCGSRPDPGELLRAACDSVYEATPDDAVDGVLPTYVAAPRSVAQAAQVMRASASAGLRIAPRGAGTKLGWGAPPEGVEVVLDVRGLDRLLEYNPGDLVLSAEAGVPLRHVQAQVAAHGQLLGLDPPEERATLGGIIAANASGPRRLRYGSARDLLIGVTAVLADATVAQAGGKVVKNVAGYDLMKLYCGSLGTLGVIVSTTWRLHPRPPERRVVTLATFTGETVQAVAHSQLTPTAVEVLGERLVVVFESTAPSVQAQATAAVALIGGEISEELPAGFGERPWTDPAVGADGIGLSIAFEPAALPQVRAAVARLSGPERPVLARGRAASGVLEVGLPTLEPAELAGLRAAVAAYDGSVVVRSAPPQCKAALDVWGSVGNALPLMQRVKERFDPDRRLSPGRYVGGI
jgi:glycolate oxidase FAD binding subunit